MNEGLYEILKQKLEANLSLTNDKPEETIESTLKALWHVAAGFPKSVEEAVKYTLPVLTEEQVMFLQQLVDKRISHIPLAYLTGYEKFMDIELKIDSRALIPRKETEILANKALELSFEISEAKEIVRVIDACCGSGNLGIAMAYYNRKAKVMATDISSEAVCLAQENINLLKLQKRVSVMQGDLLTAFDNQYYEHTIDLIICNPPYISRAKVSKMDKEISENEPVLAFDGGPLGFNIIRRLISEAPKLLIAGGWLIMEVGLGQGDFIVQMCERSTFYSTVSSEKDRKGNIRVIKAKKN